MGYGWFVSARQATPDAIGINGNFSVGHRLCRGRYLVALRAKLALSPDVLRIMNVKPASNHPAASKAGSPRLAVGHRCPACLAGAVGLQIDAMSPEFDALSSSCATYTRD